MTLNTYFYLFRYHSCSSRGRAPWHWLQLHLCWWVQAVGQEWRAPGEWKLWEEFLRHAQASRRSSLQCQHTSLLPVSCQHWLHSTRASHATGVSVCFRKLGALMVMLIAAITCFASTSMSFFLLAYLFPYLHPLFCFCISPNQHREPVYLKTLGPFLPTGRLPTQRTAKSTSLSEFLCSVVFVCSVGKRCVSEISC